MEGPMRNRSPISLGSADSEVRRRTCVYRTVRWWLVIGYEWVLERDDQRGNSIRTSSGLITMLRGAIDYEYPGQNSEEGGFTGLPTSDRLKECR